MEDGEERCPKVGAVEFKKASKILNIVAVLKPFPCRISKPLTNKVKHNRPHPIRD